MTSYVGKHRRPEPDEPPLLDPLMWELSVVEPCGTVWSVDDTVHLRVTWHSCALMTHGPEVAHRCGCGDLLGPILRT